jgi:hypothetical protein
VDECKPLIGGGGAEADKPSTAGVDEDAIPDGHAGMAAYRRNAKHTAEQRRLAALKARGCRLPLSNPG